MTDNKERQEFINTELASFIKEQGTKGVFTKCVELGFHAGFRTGERLAKIEVLEELKTIIGVEFHFRSIAEKLKALAKIKSMLADIKAQKE